MNQRLRISLLMTPVALVGFGLILAPALRSAPVPAPAKTANAQAAFAHENKVAMDRMMGDMHVASTGDVDRDFTRMMIPHHQGAIDMAEALLRYGKNPELKALARGIISTQRREIAVMRRIGGTAPAAPAPAAHHHAMD